MLFFVIFSSMEINAENVDFDKNNYNVEVIIPENTEKFIEEMGWEKPHPDAELVEVIKVEDNSSEFNLQDNNVIEPNFLFYSVRNVRYAGESCGSIPVLSTSGTGGVDGTLTLSSTATVSNTFSANVGVSAGTVSSGVGFDVTDSQTRTSSYSVNTNGYSYQIDAYDFYNAYAFDIHNILLGTLAGSGNAYQQKGFCYAAYRI